MKIYVSHASSYDFKNELYAPLKQFLPEHELFLPHENSDDANNNAKKILKKCDIILAEVSYPSTGQGIELGWADMLQKPIVCIYKTDAKPSSAVPIVASATHQYASIESVWLEALIKNLQPFDI